MNEGDLLIGTTTNHVAMRYVVALSVALAMALMGGAFAAFRWLVKRLIDGMDERIKKIEDAQIERDRVHEKELQLLEQQRTAELRRLEFEIQAIRAEMPLHYLRREDHIREMTQVGVKLDRIYEILLLPKGRTP